jgi:HEAT repeat protein
MGQSPRRGIGVAIGLGVGALALVGVTGWLLRPAASPAPAPVAAVAAAPDASRAFGTEAPLATLVGGVREGDGAALAALAKRAAPDEAAKAKAMDPAEAVGWIDAVAGLRVGYPRFSGTGRASAVATTAGILGRFAVEGTPAGWDQILPPSFDVLSAGLADPDTGVRMAALDAVAGLWLWSPGCTMTPGEEKTLAAWKGAFHPIVVNRLADAGPSRARAVACLGALPLDDKAAPALKGLNDPDLAVRLAVLSAFANRPMMLSEEAILPLLHDPIPDLRGLAERVLRARGLSADLIGLGRLVTHPRPEMRATAIPLLVGREDLDPVVWLLRLTEDADESVRLKAVEAFAGRLNAAARQRLREIAAADDSPSVRQAAAKLVPTVGAAVALPPLPGTTSLGIKAN